MKNVMGLKSLSYLAVAFFLFLASCADDKNDFSSNDSSNVENEASTDSYFEDADDMSTVAVWSDNATAGGREATNGKQITVSDTRFACATVTLTPAVVGSEPSNPKGTIIIDFGTGCKDAGGIVRKGKILITYAGLRYAVGATRSITFDGYFVNEVKIEGTRNVTNVTGSTIDSPKFKIEVIGGKATWADGTSATREVRVVREWKRGTNPSQDLWNVTQLDGSDFAASGSNRNGKTYQMNITKTLVYKRECASGKVFIAVQGTKELVTEKRKITIDYGTGTCDKLITITLNGESREVEVGGN
jgi:hypothetical protein